MKSVIAFVVSVVVAYVLAVLMYTQLNLANVVELGLQVSLGVRLEAAFHDLVHMVPLYLPIISVALLIAFGVARVVLIWVPQLQTLGYVLAGFLAIFTVDFALGAILTSGTHPLAVTRTTVGLLSQCVAGAIGGYVFVNMLANKPQSYLELAS